MLLTGAGTSRSLAGTDAEPKRGDALALHFSVPSGTGQRHFRVQAQIARILDNNQGVGIFFADGLPTAAFQALIDFAGAGGYVTPEPEPSTDTDTANGAHAAKDAADTNITTANRAATANGAAVEVKHKTANGQYAATLPAASNGVPVVNDTATDAELGIPLSLLRDVRLSEGSAAEIRQQIRGFVQEALEGLGAQFVELASQEFLASARDAGNNHVHQLYLEGLDRLEKHGAALVQDFVSGALGQFEGVSPLERVLERRRRRETGGGREMALIEAELFEDWLAVADIIAKSELRFGEALLDVRARFGLMARPWAHKDAVPVGPAIIAWAFADAIKSADLRRELRPDCYRYFEQVMLRSLGGFYDSLIATLEGSGRFPSTGRLREALRRRPVVVNSHLPRREPGRRRRPVRTSQDPWLEPGDYDGAGHEIGSYEGGEPWGDYGPRGAPGTRRASGLRGGDFGAIRSLARRGWSGARRGAPGQSAVAEPDAAPVTQLELLEALELLGREAGDATLPEVRVKPRLLDLLQKRHGASRRLARDDLDTIDLLESLVEALQSDRYLAEPAKAWIRSLEVTLNKLATKDRGFLERDAADGPHSAVTLLNQLARLGGGDGPDRETGRRVEELITRLVGDFDRNPDVFRDVVDELDPLVDKQTRTYRTNLERTVRSAEGRQKLVRARRAVIDAMAPRLAGREVPDLLLQLVNPGWRNLLVHTHLRRGDESREWQDQLGMFDQVQGQLDGTIDADTSGFVDPDALLKRVVQALNSISFDPAKRTPLVMALVAALIGDTTGQREPVTSHTVTADGVAAAVGIEDADIADAEPQGESGDVRENWAVAHARARRIEVGEWLAATDDRGRPEILSVAFLGDDADSFVLVNRKGVKVREYSLAEMADDLCRGRLALLDDFDLPLMERASQRMLENMHSQLAFQAAHDELTTLLNRREFERLVGRAVQTARARDETHALLYIDLDQFKIVNSTSGHTAGDQLLKRIAGWLSDAFAPSAQNGRHLARLGGDEFGLLAENCSPDCARDLARAVLDLIRERPFEWEGRPYSLSATIGLVIVDRATASVDHAMQYADEACYAAKDAGRNRIQEYRSADTVIVARHGIMEWVTALDRALAEDRLILNCQRIAPLDPESARQPHYEILLTMEDESGEVMPPAEFILAAETYQRMGAVDRWVIERVFGWMANNRSRVERFGGFAINVSGDSMNDESFPDFVLQQFELTGAPTGKVCFEITETAAIANLETAREFMNRMKIIGCSFALDDFGTGLSSYSYLRNLPVDYVKIDGVFVRSLDKDADDYAVVRSINEIGHYLGKETIAECVETPAVLARLDEIGVDYVQGYFIGRPVPLQDLPY